MGLSAVKVVPGAILAGTYEMTALEAFISISVGGIIGVAVFTYFGKQIRDLIQRSRSKGKERKHPDKKKIKRLRKLVTIWRKYGIIGVAFLTPPFLSPPGGTAIAIAFGEKPYRIILYLGASVIAWALGFALLEEQILGLFH